MKLKLLKSVALIILTLTLFVNPTFGKGQGTERRNQFSKMSADHLQTEYSRAAAYLKAAQTYGHFNNTRFHKMGEGAHHLKVYNEIRTEMKKRNIDPHNQTDSRIQQEAEEYYNNSHSSLNQ